MSNQPFILKGRVLLADKKTGAHGLEVDVFDKDYQYEKLLGSVLTRRDGSFELVYPHVNRYSALFKMKPGVFIRVKDTEGRELYRAPKARKFKADATASYKIVLPEELKLKSHGHGDLANNLKRRLIPDRIFQTIGQAFHQAAMATYTHGQAIPVFSRASLCPLPPLLELDNILEDAIDVIAGRPEAMDRFRDQIELLAREMPEDITPISQQDSGQEYEDPEYWHRIAKQSKALLQQYPQSLPSLVPRQHEIILLTAAFMAGGDSPILGHRYMRTMLGNLCGIERLGPLYRSADRFVSGAAGAMRHFRQMWGFWTGECGPDDGPIPSFPPQPGGPPPEPCPFPWPPRPGGFPFPDRPEILEKWACTAEVVAAIRAGLFYTYTIDSISPARACPGDIITITGREFGSTPGRVHFPGVSTPVDVISWSDTEVRVRVPADATCGRLGLEIFEKTVEACGVFIDIYRNNTALTHFEGGRTRIEQLIFINTRTSDCTRPGDRIRFRWSTCNADTVTVRIVDSTGVEQVTLTSSSGSDEIGLTLPDYSETTELTAEVTATGPCGTDTRSRTITVQQPFNLSIDGMEITQGIQYYRAAAHLTDAADRGPDNSVQLVVNKSAWLRVYLRSGQLNPTFEGGGLRDVTGELVVSRRTDGRYTEVARIAPNNAPVTAGRDFPMYAAERGNINSSLNFVIPANIMTGYLRLSVAVESPHVCIGDGDDESSMEIDVNLQQTLNVSGVMIRYTGPDAAGNPIPPIPAPNLANLQATAGMTLLMFPVSNANFRISSTINFGRPLNDPASCAGCCSPNWVRLNQAISRARNNDPARAGQLFYGLLPAGVPAGPIIGCESNNVSAGFNGNQPTMAHELGHRLGLAHSACGNVGATNAAPAYEPYDPPNTPGASIGEYGLNINTGAISNPFTARDFMSYCGPAWISLFSYNFLVNRPALVPTTIPTGRSGGGAGRAFFQQEEPTIQPMIIVQGRIVAEDKIEIDSLVRIETLPPQLSGERLNYRLELVNEKETAIQSTYLRRVFDEAHQHKHDDCGCGGGSSRNAPAYPIVFEAAMPDVTPGACLRIRNEEEKVVWEQKCPKKPTVLAGVKAVVKGDKLHLQWDYQHLAAESASVWVQWSNDEGKNWHGLAVDLEGKKAVIELPEIPAGEVIFKILAHDGYATTTTLSNPVKIKAQPPAVTILYPTENESAPADMPLHLWGIATSLSHYELTDEDFTWLLDGKEVGQGRDIWIDNPGEGSYELVLLVKDPAGEGKAGVKLQVG